jgi:hypothetical protein
LAIKLIWNNKEASESCLTPRRPIYQISVDVRWATVQPMGKTNGEQKRLLKLRKLNMLSVENFLLYSLLFTLLNGNILKAYKGIGFGIALHE